MKSATLASSMIVLPLILALTSLTPWASVAPTSLDESQPTTPPQLVDSVVINPRLISRVDPVYPEEARTAEFEAMTILQVMIRRNGSVETNDDSCLKCDVNRKGEQPEEVLRGWCDDFCRSSSDAVSQWKYEPGKKDGEPVDVYFAVVVEYKIP